MVRPQVTDRKPRDRGPPSHAFTIQEFCDAHRFSRAHYYNLKRSAGAPTRPRSAIASSSRSNRPNAGASSTPQLASDPHPTTPPRKRREGAPSGYPGALSFCIQTLEIWNATMEIQPQSSEVYGGFIRRRCRNSRCGGELNRETDNPRNAFCCRGCFDQHYRRCCLVCERPLPKALVISASACNGVNLNSTGFRGGF